MSEYVHEKYSRPNFRRSSYIDLDGEWSFSFDQPVFDRRIIVPFCYESESSGINEKKMHSVVWYRKTVENPLENGRLILHFGAIDFKATVWVNNQLAGTHLGGQTSFEFDITELLGTSSVMEIVVKAEDDHTNLEIPRGKQYWKDEQESIFYTHTTGIWKSVWMEIVPETYLQYVKITPCYDEKAVKFSYRINGKKKVTLKTEIVFEGVLISKMSVETESLSGSYTIQLDQPAISAWNYYEDMTWTPEKPRLFNVYFRLESDGGCDQVQSYFGLRKISVENGRLLLNNRPYFLKMILDQGYWPDTLMTPRNDEVLIKDISLIKEMGFNGVRIHQKIEDPRFYYYADHMGLAVWGEIGSAYLYSNEYVSQMTREWIENIEQNYNYPSIIAWTLLNESWGVQEIKTDKMQTAHCQSLYYLAKSLDQTRLVIDNDGWEHISGDLLTIHDYESDASIVEKRYHSMNEILSFTPAGHYLYVNQERYNNAPVIVSEFGGVRLKDAVSSEQKWGYSTDNDVDSYVRHVHSLFAALKKSPHLCGYCYTQFNDIGEEENGLLKYDRTPKVDLTVIRSINES